MTGVDTCPVCQLF